MRTPKLLSKLSFKRLSLHPLSQKMDEGISDLSSRGPEFSNNVFQERKDHEHDNGNDMRTRSPRLLSDKRICGNCSVKSTPEDSVCCLLCDNSFHALCYELKDNKKVYHNDNACTQTFFTLFQKACSTKKNSTSRFGNFVFVCDPCLTAREQRNATNVNAHVHSLEQKMSSMETDISTIKELLISHSTAPLNPPSPNVPLPSQPNLTPDNPWNDSDRVQKLRHPATVVIHDDSGECVPLPDLENIITKNSIEANNTFKNKDGNTVITLSSQAERTKLMNAIKQDFPQSDVRQPKEKIPTISVAGIKGEITPEKLKDQIMMLYPEIKSLVDSGESFDVLTVRKQRNHTDENKFHQASIRVSNCIRKLIENRDDYLSVGLYRCKVYDHFYIKRCNKCQQFGHYKAQCASSKPVCAECSGNHDTLDCDKKSEPTFQPSCVNCKSSKKDTQQHTHSASDRSCPAYQAEQNKLKDSISYYTKKNW